MKDTEILDLYWERDEQAIVETQKSYGSYCRSIACNILYNNEDTEECLNDTWLKTWNSIPPARPERFSLYLGTITRNLALDRWKSKHREKRGGGEMTAALDELAEFIPDRFNTEETVIAAEMERFINDFLHTLPEKDCNIFLRRYWYVEDYAAIAKRYHMKLNTVKTSLFRTRTKLKECLLKEGFLF